MKFAIMGFSIALILSLFGCSSAIRGRVVVGSLSTLEWVEENDPRLTYPSVPGVSIAVSKSETRRHFEEVGRGMSGGDGSFSIAVNSAGAGFLEEMWLISAQGGKYGSAESTARLPFDYGSKHLLIILEAGSANPGGSNQREDIEGQIRSIKGFEQVGSRGGA